VPVTTCLFTYHVLSCDRNTAPFDAFDRIQFRDYFRNYQKSGFQKFWQFSCKFIDQKISSGYKIKYDKFFCKVIFNTTMNIFQFQIKFNFDMIKFLWCILPLCFGSIDIKASMVILNKLYYRLIHWDKFITNVNHGS